MTSTQGDDPRPPFTLFLIGALIILSVAALTGLGIWQLERRAWKLELIQQVQERVNATPVAAPGPATWPSINATNDAYRHVTITGHFLHDHETLVRASTEHGSGFWVMTPLQTNQSFIVFINRGFVPYTNRDPLTRSAGQVSGEITVTGLMRMSEPHGTFLQKNNPHDNRWYSRDIPAIAKAQHLATIAPYFIDADATPNPGGLPVGGLTVLTFWNHHLIYAITWFTLAAMLAGGTIIAWRDSLRKALHARNLAIDSGMDVTNYKNMFLLIHLRWFAVAGQIITIAFTRLQLGITLPLAQMTMVIAALIILNLSSLIWLHHYKDVSNRALFRALICDVLALTIQCYLSGGASNPFIFLYLLQITLAIVLLDRRSSWMIAAMTCIYFAILTVFNVPLAIPGNDVSTLLRLHISGMLLCFGLDAILLVAFITRISKNLRDRDTRLAALKQQAIEENLIVRMGLLASGAAHELGTPLALLSVIVNDWQHMPELTANTELQQEIEEMQAAVERCKSIVTGILLTAGDARGDAPVVTTVHHFFDGIIEEWHQVRTITSLHYSNLFGEDVSIVSDTVLKQIVFNLLDNACEASPHWLEAVITRENNRLVIRISDAGPGFTQEILAQFGTPYKSSKGRMGGGLGLFLVVNVIRKLGGVVIPDNRPEGGAVVTLQLPLTALLLGDINHA